MSSKKVLLMFILNSFSLYTAKVVKKTEVKKIETKEVKEIKKEEQQKDETTVNLETTFKFNYNQHFNPNYLDYKVGKEDKNKDAFDTEETNSFVYKENFYNVDFFNSKFKFNLYDDIELYIPFGISYKIGYPKEVIEKIQYYYLTRAIIANLGFSLSWKALDYLKLGINGDFDEDAGYAFNLESKLFKSQANELDSEGIDIFKYGAGIFGQFEVKNSWAEFKPKLRIKFNKGRELKNRDENDTDLTPSSGSIIVTPLIALPVDFKWELIEDLKFMINFALNSYWSFADENYLRAIKYENSGLKIDASLKLVLEYKLFNTLKLVLPIKATTSNEIFRNENAATDWTSNILHVGPKIDFSLDIFDNLKFLADVTTDYKFLALSANPTKSSTTLYTDPRIKWGFGFKFDSAL